MTDIVISEFMDQAAVESLAADYAVHYGPGLADDPDALIAAVGGARALIVRNRTQVRGDLLTAARRLRVVGRLGVGLDNIDVAACERRGIVVCPATGANDLAVAEYVIAMTLVLLRGAYHSQEPMLAGCWPRDQSMGRETSGKHLGLVGFGAIARQTAVRAAALGMDVGAFDPHLGSDDPAWERARRFDFDALLRWSDVVSLHVPLTDATRCMMDRSAIDRMKPGAVLINAARGGVVDESALAEALRTGRLSGAALDVFEDEPLTRAASQRFQGLANLVLTPHIAGVTKESNQRVSALTAANIRRVLEGEAP